MGRPDGTRVKNADPMYTIVPYIMPKRYDAQNMIELFIPLEPLQNYRTQLRQSGRAISYMGILLAAYLRTMTEYPLLNRFIANKRIYDRNEIAVGMVVLKPGEDNGSMNKMHFQPGDTLFDVQNRIDAYVEENRQKGDHNATDKLITFLLKMPGLITFIVGLLKLMDHMNILPKKIIDASPFHVSLVISNLASIRTNHIYHHCYQFGTTSMIITMGNAREVPIRRRGEVVFERCLPLGVVMDERICSGSYYAQAFHRMSQFLANPTLLETAP